MTVEEARRTLQMEEVAQQLLSSPIMARLAYTWSDGTPRGYQGQLGQHNLLPCCYVGRSQEQRAGRIL